ncbi:tRNA (adenosine(37)-N6)-dimethylallyltransferase MiaA [Litorimonas sp. RW-G-Af-16]|uniref:tRNA (adenosine(37)-N6)-dimethylallyltransferase MiaA n=1 Tax=Litorimonas sp. RW-G-Af-16 TaxID=3241168 RepID=UPI00390C4DC7
MKRVICIAGPTASGKSAFAVRLAKAVGGEVINADSMQVYRELQVLSARPDATEMAGVAHHLFGHISGSQRYSTGAWQREVVPVILDCLAQDVTPILTGGTGLYFKSLTEGIADIPDVDNAVSQSSQALLDTHGIAKFREMCADIDPIATAQVQGHDPQRLLRIYDVWAESGAPLSTWQAKTRPIIPVQFMHTAVLLPPRQSLYEKINQRFDQMVELGGVDEARLVQALGLDPSLPMMKAIGLSHLLRHFQDKLSYAEAIDLAKRDSRRLAKRQMTWFRNQTPDWQKLETAADREAFLAHVVANPNV